MMRRSGLLLLMALVAGAPGCAGTARRDDGSYLFGPKAWNPPSAPPQRAVDLAPTRPDTVFETVPKRDGLAKFFPGFQKKSIEAPAAATVVEGRPRFHLFGPKSPQPTSGTLTYTTDTRALLDRSGPTPATLPVALQIYSDRASSDRQVTPTGAVAVIENPLMPPVVAAGDRAPDAPMVTPPVVPDQAPKPASTSDEAGHSTPPTADPAPSEVVVNRTPELPEVDPKKVPPTETPETKPAPADDPAPEQKLEVATAPKPDEPVTTDESKAKSQAPPMPAPSVPDSLGFTAPRAIPPRPSPQVKPTPQVMPSPQVKPTPQVMPSPQVKPTPQVMPSPQVKPTPQVMPSPQVKPTPQVTASPQVKPSSQVRPSPQSPAPASVSALKQTCLCRLFRKICKLGEFADPHPSASH